jgi:aspartate carbamoyltransferase catalytic subunit
MSGFTQQLKKLSSGKSMSNKGETLYDQILIIQTLKSSGMTEQVNKRHPKIHILTNTDKNNLVYVEQRKLREIQS